MTERMSRQARRRFLKLAVAGAAAMPLCGTLRLRQAHAQEQVSPDDEMPKELGYVEDASQVDAGAWPTYEEGQTCANCQLFRGQQGQETGPCDIFMGNLVAAAGWCSAWVAREG
jgi:High potential iron-sulfur protein